MPDDTAPVRNLTSPATEVLYTAVGAGLLGAQRLMVARHDARRNTEALMSEVCRTVDGALDAVEALAPGAAGSVIGHTRRSARDVGRFVSVILGLDITTDRPGPTEP